MKEQIVAGQWAASQKSWSSLLDFIDTKSGNVVRLVYFIFVLIFKLHSSNNIIYSTIFFFWQDVYNFMLDSGMDPVALPVGSSSLMSSLQAMKYSTYGQDSQPGSNTIDGIMNGVIKQKLKIIPKNFTYVSP